MRSVYVTAVLLMALARQAMGDSAAIHGFGILGVEPAQLQVIEQATLRSVTSSGLVGHVELLRPETPCAGDPACHCSVARKQGVTYAIYGSAGLLADTWSIEFTLLETHTCRVSNTVVVADSFAPAELGARVALAVRTLMTPLSQIDATATKTERDSDEVAAIVSSFSRSDLRELHIRRLEDVLPLVPGMEAPEANWGATVLNQGFANTLLFVSDGIPLVNGLNNFRSLDRDFRTSLGHLDKIEIARGPGSVLWGQNAFLGVVNLRSGVGIRKEIEFEGGSTAGSLNSQELWARARQRREQFAFSISAAAGRRVGPTTDVAQSPYAPVGVAAAADPWGNSGTTDGAADTWFDTTAKLQIGRDVSVGFSNFSNNTNFEISPQGALLDPGAGGWWRKSHRIYSLGWQHSFESWQLSAQAARYEYISNENFAVSPMYPSATAESPTILRDGLRSLQGNRDPRLSHFAEVRAVNNSTIGDVGNRSLVGLSLLQLHTPVSFATLVGISRDPTDQTTSFGRRNFLNVAGFASDEVRPTSWLWLTAGMRAQVEAPYQGSSRWRSNLNFQSGAVLKFARYGGKLVYAEGFRSPDAVQLFSEVGTKGNRGLQPEKSREIAMYAFYDPIHELSLRIGGNLTRISQLIVLSPISGEPGFAYTPINQGRTDIASVFVEAKFSLGQSFDALAHYHATFNRESDPLDIGTAEARHTGAATAIFRPWRDFSVFARLSWSSPRTLLLDSPDGASTVRTHMTLRTATGFTVANVLPQIDFDLDVSNPLLRYQDIPYRFDGAKIKLIERRVDAEVFATLRFHQ
jgi:hypothetical protein